mgnify:CR=1 FL=1
MSIVYTEDKYGIATCDVTTGDFFTTEVDTERKLLDEVSRFNPSEIICNEAFYMSGIDVDDMKKQAVKLLFQHSTHGIFLMVLQMRHCFHISMYRQ